MLIGYNQTVSGENFRPKILALIFLVIGTKKTGKSQYNYDHSFGSICSRDLNLKAVDEVFHPLQLCN
jgi:hypothetical protein